MVTAAEVATERKAGAQLVATRRRVDALFCDSERVNIHNVIRKLTAAGEIITIKFSVLNLNQMNTRKLPLMPRLFRFVCLIRREG